MLHTDKLGFLVGSPGASHAHTCITKTQFEELTTTVREGGERAYCGAEFTPPRSGGVLMGDHLLKQTQAVRPRVGVATVTTLLFPTRRMLAAVGGTVSC